MAQPPTVPLSGDLPEVDGRPTDVLDGRYRLESIVGRGGMGTVYRALDVRLNRHVAIKVLRDVHGADVARFRSEIETLARLSHPGLVRILDAGGLDARPYLVMELIDGKNLAQYLEAGPLRPEMAATIGASVAAALAYVHGNGVVHRDVKPANVLIDQHGGAHLAEFGVARLAETTGLTTTGLTLGTPAYLAPEQIEGGDIGPSADVYALGLVLIECLSGRRAFEGTPAEITGARLQRDPAIPGALSDQWRQTLSAMTAREARERLGARAAATQLGGLIHADDPSITIPIETRSGVYPAATLPIVGYVARGFDATESSGATAVLPRSIRRRPGISRWTRRRRIYAVAAGAGIAIVAIGLALGALMNGAHGTPGANSPGAGRPSVSTSSTTAPTTSTIATSQVALDVNAIAQQVSSGVASGTIAAGVAQQMTNQLQQILSPATTSTSPPQIHELSQLVQTFTQAVQSGAISGTSTIATLSASINHLATALGTSAPLSTLGATPSPAGPGHGHGHGFGNDN